MKIALLTLGTRGDVQPYAVLGRALKDRGHEVTLSTATNFESFARSYGIGFRPVQADFQALVNSPEGREMMKNPFRARKYFKQLVHPMIYDSLTTFYGLAKESDCVLYHVKALGDYYAEKFPEKMIRANVVPAVEPTAEFPNPVFSGLSVPAFFNRFTYTMADAGLRMMHKPIMQFREANSLGKKISKDLAISSIYGISSNFLARPKDYPSNSYFTGFWFDESSAPLSAELLQFLKAGAPPLLITFGSMPFDVSFDLQKAVVNISKRFDLRILVVKGWGFENTDQLQSHDTIKVINSAPFGELLPLVKAAVHHGGIGTTAECLRAGIPFLPCPVIYPMGDQHFWSQLAYQKGYAVHPVPLKKLSETLLTERVKELLYDEQLYNNVRGIKETLKSEHGVQASIRIIENHFAGNKALHKTRMQSGDETR
jgi:sterol 3beta-glucosyltransferase